MSEEIISRRVAQFILELFTLNNTVRSGWRRARVPLNLQQTVASHTFGAAEIALALAYRAAERGISIDVGRTEILVILHDIGETRTGDFDRISREILEEQGLPKDQIDARAEQRQTQGLPRGFQNFLRSALNEYRRRETLEAKTAYDAQLIEMGIQALLYEREGYSTQEFMEFEGDLRTEEGQHLWQIIKNDPEIFNAWFTRRPRP